MKSPNFVLVKIEREYSPMFIGGKEIYIDPSYHELHHKYPVGKVVGLPNQLRKIAIAAIKDDLIYENDLEMELELGDTVVMTWLASEKEKHIGDNVYTVSYNEILFKNKRECVGLYSVLTPMRPPNTYMATIDGFEVCLRKEGFLEQVVNGYAKGYGTVVSSKEFSGIVHYSNPHAYYVTVEGILYVCVPNHYIDFEIDQETYNGLKILDLFQYEIPALPSAVDLVPEFEYKEPPKPVKYYV